MIHLLDEAKERFFLIVERGILRIANNGLREFLTAHSVRVIKKRRRESDVSFGAKRAAIQCRSIRGDQFAEGGT
jgi:hypothetical protein